MAPKIKPRHLQRYREIATLLARHGRRDLVRTAGIDAVLADEPLEEGDPKAAARLADDLEAMGPTFVKLGQLMSSRVDLLAPAYVEALSRLQDKVEPFPFEEVEEIVSTELGVRLSKVFPTFDHRPLAAASLGQVHRATLRDGREVVVKVQRPGIRHQVLEDMEVLTEITDLLDAHTDLGRRYGLGDLLQEFRRSLMDELDYRREAENLVTVRGILGAHPTILVPEPYPDLSTSRVLTMEYVEGRKVTDLGPLGQLELDGAPLADALFAAYLKQVLVEGVFHADPHPGNVLLTPDHRLVLLDIGMVARLAPAYRDKLVKLFLALADGRPEVVTRVVRTMGEELPDFDAALFERAVTEVVGRSADASLSDLDVGATVLQLTRKAGEAGLRMDPELVMLGKTLLNLDQVAATLDPDFEPREALRRHTSELMRSSMHTSPAAMMASLLEAKEFVEALPGRVNRAFDAIGEGHFELRVKAFDEDEFLRGLHKLANVIAAGLILASMILASALLARTSGEAPTTENRIALVVFVVAVVVAMVMLVRIALQTRNVRSHRRT
ncbi:AarF/ABC1/UbiB kinase family protein [Nocardioides sp. WL0053]|uniref:AarF/ABC1/UbiB kinase family protein n=1 Tax=Nocardioides jiangsuensis TaxID=2866161 RepID=A0ABS7RLW3_9ACTN|nr:AarF/UbiB family protein [Nocardioides jiangsuensis]MBY9074845.1 AarF/ABC1/UbiB kinase family protein [Nocardioides jiangsuensis]